MTKINILKKYQRKISSENRLKISKSLKVNNIYFIQNLKEKIFFNNSKIVASFISIKSEIPTNFLNKFILESKKILCLPKIKDNKELLFFHEYNYGVDLIPGKFGVMEPSNSKSFLPDIILTPCLAFDSSGYRLGYGGGYYDKTIFHLKSINHKFITIALAYDDQKVEKVIHDHLDQKLDYILTEKQLYKIL